MIRFAISSLLVLLLAGAALADDSWNPIPFPEMTVQRTDREINIDGVIDPAEWADAARAEQFVEHQPGDQVRPHVDTEVLVTYDRDNLYVAFICYDDPAQVRASMCKRDRIFQDDYVILCLDTYGDAANAFEIACNPYGVQGDLYYSANGGEDINYDMIFESSGRINGEGWVVELAVPFSSLRFPDTHQQVWKADFWRNSPRDSRYQISWPKYDRDESCWPCQWGTLRGIEGLTPPTGLELLPAVVSQQASGRQLLDDGAAGEWDNADVVTRGSLTAKYAVSSNITAEATIRPDFSQVESDAAQIDVNSRYALFYPEKRPFFMERADLFNTFFNAVYTRSINDPTVAGKVTGRSGKTSFAVLSALDRNTAIILPFEEESRFVRNGESWSNIFRVKQELSDQTYVGVVGTDRRYTDGGSGSLFGVDSRIRLDRNYQIELQYLHSFTDEPDDPALSEGFHEETFDSGKHTKGLDGESFDGSGIYASFERSGRNWSFDFDYWDRSPTFRAENGFETSNAQRNASIFSMYIFRLEDSKWLEWVNPSVRMAGTWNFDGVRKDASATATVELKLRKMQTSTHSYYRKSQEVFAGSEYDTWMAHTCWNTTPAKWLRSGLHFNVGNTVYYAGEEVGRQIDYGGWFDLKPWDRLLWEFRFSHSQSDAIGRDENFFDGYVMRSKLSLQMTRELSLRLVLQYDNFRDTWEADPLLTYQLNPFSLFYAGSTRDYRLYGVNDNPEETSWQLSDRQYFLKFQYLFKV
jgi:hypothetical protein